MHYTQDELQHYGIPGMKWGVRRDARLLANRRRNVKVRKIKDDYDSGKITKTKKKLAIQKANDSKKTELLRMRSEIKNTSGRENVRKMRQSFARQTLNEVPSRRIKKGLTTVNKVLGTYHTAVNAGSTIGLAVSASVVNPALGLSVLTAGSVGTAAHAGIHYLAQMGIDRLT